MNIRMYILLMLSIGFCSCGNNKAVKDPGTKPGAADMEELNRYMIQKDRERIISYIERKDLHMTESPTGLWYQIIEQGNGDFLMEEIPITMEYECSLLDGTVCYSSDESGPMRIVLGRTSIEPGLNEGLRLLKPGARAIFILPPFLARGLPGDGRKIPARSVIVYKVNILPAE